MRAIWSYHWFDAAASDVESSDSDYDEFQKCEICSNEEVVFIQLFSKKTFLNCLDAICVGFIYFSLQERENLLQCSLCGKYAHQSCVVPPIRDIILKEWACNLCKNKTVEYLPPRTNIIEQQKRFRTTSFIILWPDLSFYVQ
jgi:hypothetical protein